MNIVIAQDGRVQDIGYQTDNNRTQVWFDIGDVMNEYPGGMAVLAVQRPGESTGFVSPNTEVVDNYLRWTVESYFLEHRGILEAQVVYSLSDTVANQKIYRFNVDRAILSLSEAPSGWETMAQQMLQAAASVHAEVETVQNYLDATTAARDEAVAARNEAVAANTSAGDASAAAIAAQEQSALDAQTAVNAKDSAVSNALKAEGHAVGTQNGVPVNSESDYYHNNAAWYADAAEQVAADAGFLDIYINEVGNLIYRRTTAVDADFYLDANGDLILTTVV